MVSPPHLYALGGEGLQEPRGAGERLCRASVHGAPAVLDARPSFLPRFWFGPRMVCRVPESTSVPEEATDIFSVNPAATCSPEPKEPRCAHGG